MKETHRARRRRSAQADPPQRKRVLEHLLLDRMRLDLTRLDEAYEQIVPRHSNGQARENDPRRPERFRRAHRCRSQPLWRREQAMVAGTPFETT